MKVLFLKDIKGTAKKYDIKDVREGFARNYLIPQGHAVAATPEQIRSRKRQRESEARSASALETSAQELKKKLEGRTLIVRAKASERGHLFGAVSSRELSKELHAQFGAALPESAIHLSEPLRTIGEHTVDLKVGHTTLPLLILIEPTP